LTRSLAALCYDVYGLEPRVEIVGQVDTALAFVPEHLHFIMQEIIKNAMRATIEAHSGGGRQLPPVTVEIMKGSFDVTLKVSDQGGGIPRAKLEEIWKYGYTTAGSREALDVAETQSSGGALDYLAGGVGMGGPRGAALRGIAGYGFGLPLSRVYATYFGRDIHLQSMPGYGTDVYVNINHLGDMPDTDSLHRLAAH